MRGTAVTSLSWRFPIPGSSRSLIDGECVESMNTSGLPKGPFWLLKEQKHLMALLESDSPWSGKWPQVLLLRPQGGGPCLA